MFYSPGDIAKQYVEIGCRKAGLSTGKLLGLSFLAGVFVSLAAVGANTASCMISNPGVAKLMSALVFPAGLAMILLAGSELFTGNCLLILPVLERRITPLAMVRCLCLAYLGNLAGSILTAGAILYSGQLNLFSGALGVYTIQVAATKSSLGFTQAVLLGIFCNFLVCIAVWMGYSGQSPVDKVAAIYLPVLLFVLCGFEHCVANMYYIPAGIFALSDPELSGLALAQGVDVLTLSWKNFLFGNLLPVTLGNIIGGSGMVGAIYWAIYLKKSNKTIEVRR